MQANYYNLAFRLLLKNKVYVLINVLSLGVAIGISIIAYWVHEYEYGFNTYFNDAGQIYRLHTKDKAKPDKDSPKLSCNDYQAFVNQHQKDVHVSRYKLSAHITRTEDTHLNSYVVTVDKGFFDIFSFEFLHPPMSNNMRSNSIVLTQNLANKLFGNSNPVGQTLLLEGDDGVSPLMVFAVLKEIPKNTSLWFDAIVPFSSYRFFSYPEPKVYDAVFYKAKVDTATILPTSKHLFASPLNKLPELEDSLMESKFNGIIEGQVTRTAITALLLIFLAAFNFMNTSLSAASDRLKEIGLRKVVGATPGDLFVQIYLENMVLVVVSLFLGIGLSEFFVEVYNSWWGTMKIQANYNDFGFYLYLLILLLAISLLSCAYPAFYLSRFSPGDILRKQIKVVFNKYMSKFLLLGQFTITAYLIFMLNLFVQNYYFLQKFDKGFRYENIINVRIHNLKHYLGIKSALMKKFPKAKVCGTQDLIGFNQKKTNYSIHDKTENVVTFEISFNYPRFMELELKQGRWLSINKKEIVVNERFAEKYNNPQSVLIDGEKYTIVGIVRDFSVQNMQRGNTDVPVIRQKIKYWCVLPVKK